MEGGSRILIGPKVFSIILFPRLELDLVYLHRDIFLQLRFFTFVVPACFCFCLDHLKLMRVYAFYFLPFPNLFAPWSGAPWGRRIPISCSSTYLDLCCAPADLLLRESVSISHVLPYITTRANLFVSAPLVGFSYI